jgi:beta-lactamase class A
MPRSPEHAQPLLTRRQALLWAAAAPLLLARPAWAASAVTNVSVNDRFTQLEQLHRRRLGVYAVDTGTGKDVGFRAQERFPFCSTFKALLAAAMLAKDASNPGLLERRIAYTHKDLVSYSPVTEKHIGTGLTVSELCAAVVEHSDNGAANLLLRELGGPAALTAYARAIGNPTFRLDRVEPELNTSVPGDPRDTSTPAHMAHTMHVLALGDALSAPAREQFQAWLLGNKTGDRRIRAGTPAGWRVGDKTGTGAYGTANDFGVIWPQGRAPIVLAIYTTSQDKNAKADEELIVKATRIAIASLT